MRKLLSIIALTSAATMHAEPANASRLIDQYVANLERVCVYEGAGQERLPGQRPPRVFRVGVGEPCPVRYPGEGELTTEIPAYAILTGQRTENGVVTCYYTYMGRYYRRQIDVGALCPVSPN